jgi:hypothetical protein
MSAVPVPPPVAPCGCRLILRPCPSCDLGDFYATNCEHAVQPTECPECEASWTAG